MTSADPGRPTAAIEPRFEAVVIGASAGALDALSEILPTLPPAFPFPILIVVHIPPDRNSMLPELMQRKCQLRVKEAEDKEPIEPGTIYFAPPDYHLLVENDGRLSLSNEAPVQFSRPSIDVLFESAADTFGSGLIGIILSGANNDGARGLSEVVGSGGTGLVQLPEQAYASMMPQSALQMSPTTRGMSLEAIAAYLREVGSPP